MYFKLDSNNRKIEDNESVIYIIGSSKVLEKLNIEISYSESDIKNLIEKLYKGKKSLIIASSDAIEYNFCHQLVLIKK